MHRRYRLPHVPPDVEALGRGEAHRAVVAADAVELKPSSTSFFPRLYSSVNRASEISLYGATLPT